MAMHATKDDGNISSIIHKKKEAKKNHKAKGQMPIVQKDSRTIGEGSTEGYISQEPFAQEVEEQLDNRHPDKARTRTQRLNFEIDQFLFNLLTEGMIVEAWLPYYAKACHALGIAMVNRIAINARNGKTPDRLFAYKVKGAMNLHYKQIYYNDNPGITSEP